MDKDLLNNDPWLASLYWLTGHFGLRRHPQQLLAGLPLDNKKLNADLFPRAAEQIGLDVDRQPMLPVQTERLPVMTIDKQGMPVLIVSCDLKNIVLLKPSNTGMVEEVLPRSKLEQRFESPSKNTVWSVAAQRVTDQRADELTPGKPRHWLIQAMLEAKPWYRDLVIASLVINVLALIIPLFTMNVYDRVVPNQAFDTLWVLAVGAAFALLFDWLLRKARSSLTDMAGRQIDVKISSMLYGKVLGMKLENRPQSAGAFAKQIQEFDSVREFLTSATLTTAIDLPFTFLFLGLIAWLGGPMVLVPITGVVLLLTLSWFLQKKIKGTLEESSRLSTHRQALLIEQLQLLPDTKQHNAEGAALRRWEQTVSSLSDWQNRGRDYSNTLSYTIMNMQNLVIIGLIITGVYRISEGLMTMGGLIAVVMLSGRAASAINQLAMLLMRYEQTRTAVDGLESVMALPQEQHPQQTMSRKDFSGKTELRHASFSYPEHNQAALEDINLSIQPGECVGVMGAAGAGKSTLLALLAGQYIPTKGQVFYDGIES
ncbi:ABC transporter transmembrane domain-containing protein, partial [Pseudomaricurvus sp.]|uniref:ABC transporter transmembrane domain-containing protein n=1 Tax=Pseudomaricurvus sp. TaxID=2004510 RepID=UPI003F6D4345